MATVSVDTTARALFRSTRRGKALERDLTEALAGEKLKIGEIKPSTVSKPAQILRIDVKGLG